jgi:hypothetical protein
LSREVVHNRFFVDRFIYSRNSGCIFGSDYVLFYSYDLFYLWETKSIFFVEVKIEKAN